MNVKWILSTADLYNLKRVYLWQLYLKHKFDHQTIPHLRSRSRLPKFLITQGKTPTCGFYFQTWFWFGSYCFSVRIEVWNMQHGKVADMSANVRLQHSADSSSCSAAELGWFYYNPYGRLLIESTVHFILLAIGCKLSSLLGLNWPNMVKY